ncbi:phenylalanine ammonia-lyase [Sporothrix schenckii 1099-18]|uniref:Phenylalanine ammonia-lyase n=1 Tax=Sporothrix schenckii 1099-18 TaxID=1397361 RepID=A0A0F2MG86_SPOSC|nr:phenylalanine ammonia-lyase [Sporothrix schenckii 1099-18]KJR88637.1 phenylalanine ammonia-lyase [Sporothrix schenckii 1099-18]
MPHLQMVCREWAVVRAASKKDGQVVSVTGGDLTIADVVAVALYGSPAQLTTNEVVRDRMTGSVDFLASKLNAGGVIYGVNTGFGGSADTRTQDFHRLQSALVQLLNVGILLPSDKGQVTSSTCSGVAANVDMLVRSHALPPAIVRAMMLVRGNSLARGHSAVRVEVVESLLHLLAANMTPVVPLRGSISASGDLAPLSYVAGTLEGNPGVYVRCQESVVQESLGGEIGPPLGSSTRYLPSDQALKAAGLLPVRLQAKEGLGITNGTAPSAAAASLAVYMANQMAVWTQLLTAMSTEALSGSINNYDPFISSVRPHCGQIEAAATIQSFLQGSVLSSGEREPARAGLAQDRYALRTSPQWIGPQLEDLELATLQVATELNATTDNPLIDVQSEDQTAGGIIHHGGNFQAMAVTSAMEKTLTALQNLGRLLYAQSAELVDNSRNRGLPPNLSPDNPSTSFLCKGFDINMAAYQAELAYLARPISSHVQVAEMANQSVNSMALVAARYALEAGEVVGLMVATYVYVLCQALDLRCMQREFRAAVIESLSKIIKDMFVSSQDKSMLGSTLTDDILSQLLNRWDELSHLDLQARGEAAARDISGTLLSRMVQLTLVLPSGMTIFAFQELVTMCLVNAYTKIREQFFAKPAPASDYLSAASRVVYEFVRLELNIPFNRGIDDHPTLVAEKQAAARGSTDGLANGIKTDVQSADRTRILGTMASEIYTAVRDGRLFDRVVAFCEETKPWADTK